MKVHSLPLNALGSFDIAFVRLQSVALVPAITLHFIKASGSLRFTKVSIIVDLESE